MLSLAFCCKVAKLVDRLARNVYDNCIGTDFNGTEYTNLTWTQGRRLSSIQKGSQTYEYEYDMSGVRSVKIANQSGGRFSD
jgi:hypothetical protein